MRLRPRAQQIRLRIQLIPDLTAISGNLTAISRRAAGSDELSARRLNAGHTAALGNAPQPQRAPRTARAGEARAVIFHLVIFNQIFLVEFW